MTDYNDEQELIEFAKQNIAIAEQEYRISRQSFGDAKAKLHKKLAEAYRDDTIKSTLSAEKALIALTINDPEASDLYDILTREEQNYKGLEAVIETRKAYITLHQSLIKNRSVMGESSGGV